LREITGCAYRHRRRSDAFANLAQNALAILLLKATDVMIITYLPNFDSENVDK